MSYYYNLKCYCPYYNKWTSYLPRNWCYISKIRYAQNLTEITNHIERLNRICKKDGSCNRWRLYDITPDWYQKTMNE